MLLFCFVNNKNATAQIKGTRILFLIDASSSMTYNWQPNENRFQAAAQIVNDIIDSMYRVNNQVEFAVRVYGDQSGTTEKNCTDTRVVVPFNMQNLYQINAKLKYITPLGNSPIAYSLKEAAENELSNTDLYDYSFVLLTDGGESCGGDVCDMYKKIVANKVKIMPYIIGLDTNTILKSYYECLGQYVSVTKQSDILNAVKLIVKNNKPLLDKPKTNNVLVIPDKKIDPIVTVEPITDELRAIPIIMPIALPSKKFNPSKLIVFENNVKYTYPIVVTTPVQIDELSFVPSILPNAIALKNNNSKIAKALSLKKYNLVYPNNLITEPKTTVDELNSIASANAELIFPNSKVATSIHNKNLNKYKAIYPNEFLETPAIAYSDMQETEIVKPTEIAIPKYILKLQTPIKLANAKLPKEIAEQPIANIDMEPIGMVTAKDITILKWKEKIGLPINNKSKITLPQEMIEPTFVAVELDPIKSYAVRPQIITESEIKKGKIIANKKAIYPKDFIEPEIEPVVLELVYSAQFRYSYLPANLLTNIKKPQIKNIKPANYPTAFIEKKQIVKPPLPKPSNEKPEYKISSEASPTGDTRIAVYFTDGFGKFYTAKPMVALVDPSTKKNIKTFMRDILPGGDPEPVKLDIDGVFDVTILGQRDIVLENVTIEKNKLNKVVVKVSNGTLVFSYINNRTRAVDKMVKVRRILGNKVTPPIVYNASEQKLLEPGQYSIVVDMIPPYTLHTEISFGAITDVQIPQEGATQIVSYIPSSPVTLYYEDGDTYAEFLTVPISGDLEKQRIILRPGNYKASFIMPGAPKMAPPTIVSFNVRGNQETTIELKDYKELTVTPDGNGKPVYKDEKPSVEFINTHPLLDGNGKEIKTNKPGPKLK